MNFDQVKGRWKQFEGQVKAKWGKLTDDDMIYASGSREQLEGRIQERYGMAREEVRRQVDQFLASVMPEEHQESR